MLTLNEVINLIRKSELQDDGSYYTEVCSLKGDQVHLDVYTYHISIYEKTAVLKVRSISRDWPIVSEYFEGSDLDTLKTAIEYKLTLRNKSEQHKKDQYITSALKHARSL